MLSPSIAVALVLSPRFPLMSFAACTESLRIANRELGHLAFSRLLLTPDDGPVTSSSGIALAPDALLVGAPFAPVVVVLSSYQPEEACRPAFLAWLRKQHRRGAIIGCVDTASYILAKAGILEGRKVAVHRESLPTYQETLAGVALLDRLFAVDDTIISSAGGMATLDMMLGLIARFQGRHLADRVAHVLNYRPFPAEASAEETARDGAIARVERRLARMIERMQTNLETPLSIATICREARVPRATANRLFLRYFQATPSRYYMKIRLERAQSLLGYSPLPVGEIAAKVGFADASAFTRAYRRQFGKLPSSSRRHESGAVTPGPTDQSE